MNLYQILVVTEKELDEMSVAKPNEQGLPRYCCVTKAGTLRFWPRVEVGKCNLFAQEGA
jgi:hypothetical protein